MSRSVSRYESQHMRLNSLAGLELPELSRVWRAKAEDKVKFFIWLLLQDRIWMADRLQMIGWTHDDRCSLCDQVLEDAQHLALRRPFTMEVWHEFEYSKEGVVQIAYAATCLHDWWCKIGRAHV